MKKEWLAIEAKSFYNAYLNLEMMNRSTGGVEFFVPMAVNGAFSIELALKAILFEIGIPYEKEHNLLVLFNLLPERLQQIFWRYLACKAPEYADEKRRQDELILISNVFVEWRYSFEGNPAPVFDSRFLSAFANTAIWVMFSLGINYDIIPGQKKETDEQIFEMIDQNRAESLNRILEKVKKKQ